jgi:hypothetical protein
MNCFLILKDVLQYIAGSWYKELYEMSIPEIEEQPETPKT